MHTPEYRQFLSDSGAQWHNENGVERVGSFGDSLAEAKYVREGGLAIADRSERELLVIDGDDAVVWLQGMVTNDIFELAEASSGQLNTVVNLHGRLVAEMRLLHVLDMLLADLEPGTLDGPLLAHFKRHIITEKVRFHDRRAATARLGIYGKTAAEALDSVGRLEHRLSGLNDFQGTWGSIADEDVIVQKIPLVGVDGVELSCDAHSVERIWRALQGSVTALRPVGFEALEALRIEAGIPRFSAELNEKVIPLEAGMHHAISFTKGCYLGQEIIARLDTRGTPARELRTLILDEKAPIPASGDAVFSGKTNIGTITTACISPILRVPIALAFLKRKHNAPGLEVLVESSDSRHKARVETPGWPLSTMS